MDISFSVIVYISYADPKGTEWGSGKFKLLLILHIVKVKRRPQTLKTILSFGPLPRKISGSAHEFYAIFVYFEI